MPSFDDVFGSNVENTEVDYFGISPEDGNGQCGTGSYFGISPEGQNVVEQASQSTKGSKKRSKNFTLKEDNMLVEAWLEVSLDAVQGVDQPRATYWQRIHDYFHEHKDFQSDRNISSLSHRWGIINESVNRFCGWLTAIQNRNQSGVTEQDEVRGIFFQFVRNVYVHSWLLTHIKLCRYNKHLKCTRRKMRKKIVFIDALLECIAA